MRIAYLDCFAGIAGDMFLGALLHAGVPLEVMQQAAASLNINASLTVETVDRSGISGLKVNVLEWGELAEVVSESADDDSSTQALGGDQSLHRTDQHKSHGHTHGQGSDHEHSPKPPIIPDPSHRHGRSLSAIREIIGNAELHEQVKAMSLRAFELLGHSEARIHNVPVESIHFHEVGAVDAIVDIVAASAGIHHMQIEQWYCTPVNVGSGMVRCAHGVFPVPAPATADLLRGVPTYAAHVKKELVTPTGAALLRVLEAGFGSQPAMQVTAIGYGAGTRNPRGFPNVLRLSVGDAQKHPTTTETIGVLEAAVDDLSPQVIAYAAEKALSMGALDVMLTPVVMKKGRPGTLITVLCKPSDSDALQQLLLRETSTLGIRIRYDQRAFLERTHIRVETTYGPIRIKVAGLNGEECNAAPEFEDCRHAAERSNTSLKLVQQAAIAAYATRE